MGYLARLAQRNELTFSALQALIDDVAIDMPADVQEFEQVRGALITRWARYCPRCLAQRGRWRLGWELRFADACPGCGQWLLDTCPACGARQTWRRRDLEFCSLCGEGLLAAESREAPDAVVQLSRALEARAAHGPPPTGLAVLDGLDVEQVVQVVRLLGAYGSWDGSRVPQKILDSDALENSWTISTVAAEILCAWPTGFYHLLDRLQQRADTHSAGRMRGAFGGLYAAIYRGFKSPAFDFLRRAFEDFIATSWSGAIGRRNRRLQTSVLERVAWVPPRVARQMFGISSSELRRLVREGHVASVTRRSPSGRDFQMVRKEDVERSRRKRADFVNVAFAANSLGLKRQRLARLLPVLCPDAAKDAGHGVPWNIPMDWLQAWIDRLQSYEAISPAHTEGLVCLDYLLRYGGRSDDEIASILLGVQRGEIHAVGLAGGELSLAAMVFPQELIAQLRGHGRAQANSTWLGVPQVAIVLGVKQEVAYHWVRVGLVVATQFRERGRVVSRVRRADVEQFQRNYILGRDLARELGTSPKSLVAQLKQLGAVEVSGPSADQGRQVVFARDAVTAVMRQKT